MREISLRQAVSKKQAISNEHLNAFKDLFLKGMRSPQRKAVISRMSFNDVYSLVDEWFASRIMFTNTGGCWYVAGQDYPAEISSIRDTIIKRYS